MQVVPKQLSGLWQAIQSWLHPNVPTPDDWPTLARHQSRCSFVLWLANLVANDLIANKPLFTPIDEVCQAVQQSKSSELQHQAERFIESHYYFYPSNDPHFYRLLSIFRHLVEKRLRCSELD